MRRRVMYSVTPLGESLRPLLEPCAMGQVARRRNGAYEAEASDRRQ